MKCFEEKMLDWIQSNGLFDKSVRILLAVSGGADSVAMVHVLANLKKQDRLSCDFVIGHVNHCLRGAQSDADEEFVNILADSLGMKVCSKRVDVAEYAKANKLSIETAARVVRLKTLAATADEFDCDCIATAHHKDDLAETMIHRLMRGTGFRGLCGIWLVSEVYGTEFIRPMLGARRGEIIQYCRNNSIHWREDASNQNIVFTRNRIRHLLLPALESESGSIVNKLATLAAASRRFQLYTEKRAKVIIDKGVLDLQAGRFSINQEPLKESAAWVFYEVVRKVLVELGVGLRDYTQQHFKAIGQLIQQKKAKSEFPAQIEIAVNNGTVLIQLKKEAAEPLPESVTLQLGRTVEFGQWKISSRRLRCSDVDLEEFWNTKDPFVEWLDADKIAGDIEIRTRRDGDRFWPIGGTGEKKVGRFLQDGQLPSQIKKQAIIISDADKILWVAPARMSEKAKITSITNIILEIKID